MIDQNLDHKRASYAYECIGKIKGTFVIEKEKSYHTAVRSSGSLIQTAGLIQTLSFYISKKDKENPNNLSHYEMLAEHILKWVFFNGSNNSDLLFMYEKLLKCTDEDILYKTQEAKAFILWLKRFADSRLESGE